MTIPIEAPARMTTGYAQVLVPVDFSELGWRAPALAALVGDAFDAQVRILHVDNASPRLDDGGCLRLRTPTGELAEVEVVAATDVAAAVARAAGDAASTLLVMSTHGRSATTEFAVGATTERVLRRWRGPVLVIGPQFRPTSPMVTRIAVCVPPSGELPLALVDDVRLWATRFGVPVDVVAVTDRPAPIPFDADLLRAHLERAERVAADVATAGISVRLARRAGTWVARELVTFADEQPGTVLAMATHARPPLTRLALGSTAFGMLRHARVPVLLRSLACGDD